MKKLFVTTVLLLATTLFTASGDTYVYICTGPQSKKYHKTENCRGLNKCSGSIKKITLDEAKQIGRTPCKICY